MSDFELVETGIPDKAIVQVSGFVMLAEIDGGKKYRVEHSTHPHGRGGVRRCYTFFKPRGRKAVVKHYIEDVDPFVVHYGQNDVGSDWNKIEVIR